MKIALFAVFVLALALPCHAFTYAENEALFNAVSADPAMQTAIANNEDQAVADWFNTPSGNKGWRSYFTIGEMLDALNFTAFIGRTVGERDALNLMFSDGWINCGRSNIQQGFADIFSGTAAAAVNQRAAITSACQRDISRAEKTLSGGLSGSAYLLRWEGTITINDASRVLRGPW